VGLPILIVAVRRLAGRKLEHTALRKRKRKKQVEKRAKRSR
jgi:hypothetical protein